MQIIANTNDTYVLERNSNNDLSRLVESVSIASLGGMQKMKPK